MDMNVLAEGLIGYLFLVIIITFHECGHAWMAARCGDDTARLLGRVTLNPISHLDIVGTVILPLLVVMLSASGSGWGRFIIGWGKPVPVNIFRLRRPHLDDLWVAMAGPAMNVIVAFVALGVARLGVALEVIMLKDIGFQLALLSMYLCFFNLIPVPPLDGSYILKHLTGMTHEAYIRFSQFGIFIVIVLIQFQEVQRILRGATLASMKFLAWMWQF